MAPVKDALLRTANYDRNVDREVMGIMADKGRTLWNREFQTYYKSVLGILSHVVKSDIKWLRRLGAIDEAERARLDAVSLDELSIAAFRDELDRKIIALIESTEDFDAIVGIDFGGSVRRLRKWEWMQTWLNHHTHHRGNLSVLLDMAGIENDFSGMIGRSEPAAQ